MDNKDYRKVRNAAMEQGWRVASTKHGETFLAPDGRMKVMVHRLHASSDPRALDHIVRRLKRAGFRWPA